MRFLSWLVKLLPTLTVHHPQDIRCLSIYGLETTLRDFVCSWVHPVDYYVDQAAKLGFNSLRIPVSIQYIYEKNHDKLRSVIDAALLRDMWVVIDFHRVHDDYQEPSPETGISLDDYTNNVVDLLSEFQHYSNVLGVNSFNEYQGTNVTYLKEINTKIFDAIEHSFPGRFHYFATGTQWGGNLSGFSLENLTYADRITYSVHKYKFSGTADETDWEASFGTLFPPEKLVIGEFGWKDADEEWAKRFIDYLKKKNITNTCFWTVAHSGDTDGLWFDNCQDLDQRKFDLLKTLWRNHTT